ncbi:MAG: hypothetical protein M3508_06140, partial [Actinomycetota bacterium]|nr:hypothetical protein [Actinomycetota bacterium]
MAAVVGVGLASFLFAFFVLRVVVSVGDDVGVAVPVLDDGATVAVAVAAGDVTVGPVWSSAAEPLPPHAPKSRPAASAAAKTPRTLRPSLLAALLACAVGSGVTDSTLSADGIEGEKVPEP